MMKLYYGVYDDKGNIRRWEEKERRGEYDKYKEILREEDIDKRREEIKRLNEKEREEFKEYLKLKLSRKPTE